MPKAVILLSDNDIARAYHALVIALSAKAMGYEVHLFATGLGAYIFSRKPKTRLLGLPFFCVAIYKMEAEAVGRQEAGGVGGALLVLRRQGLCR